MTSQNRLIEGLRSLVAGEGEEASIKYRRRRGLDEFEIVVRTEDNKTACAFYLSDHECQIANFDVAEEQTLKAINDVYRHLKNGQKP